MTPLHFCALVLVLYLAILKGVAWLANAKGAKSTEGFFLSNRAVGPVALCGTTFASLLSTGTVVSAPANFRSYGVQFMWVAFFALFSMMMLLFAPKLHSLAQAGGYITPGELLEDQLQSRRVQVLTAVIGLLGMLPYASAQLVAIGLTFESLFNGAVTYSTGVLVAGIAIGGYLISGGARSVVWVDVVQGIVFSTLLLCTAVLSVHWAGGWSAVSGAVLARPPELHTFPQPAYGVLEYSLIWVSMFFLPYIWQRVYMANTNGTLMKTIAVTPILYTVLICACWVIGAAATALYPGQLGDIDLLLGQLFRDHSPYLGALLLVSAFAAGLSSVDSQLISAGSLLTIDLLPSRQRGSPRELKLAQFTTLGLLCLICISALMMQHTPVMSLILLGLSLGVCQVPTLASLMLFKHHHEQAAFWSMLLGALCFVLVQFGSGGSAFGFKAITACAGTSTLVYVVLSVLIQQPLREAEPVPR